jgi:O-acetyl-ADP-ribose deacetylase (regulator of RNase III)
VDVIIASSSSEILRKAIIIAAGNEVQTAYDAEIRTHPNSILVVTPPGALNCKKIFFVKWKPDTDDEILQQSLIDLISIVVQNSISHEFNSMGFPAIGCGQHGCSIDIVVKTMVLEMKKHLIKRNLRWTVKFIVQPDQQNIYDEFCKQVLTTQDGKMKNFFRLIKFYTLMYRVVQKSLYPTRN